MKRRQLIQSTLAGAVATALPGGPAVAAALTSISEVQGDLAAVTGSGANISLEAAAVRELGESLRIEFVGLFCALGDDTKFLGMGEHDSVGQRFDQLDKPFVAGGRLDDDLERPEATEEFDDLVVVRTGEPTSGFHFS